MEDFFTSLKLTAEQRKRAEESIMSLPDIDTKLEALYVLKTKAKRVPIALLELKQMSKQKSVFESPSLKDVREKTESLYENKMDVTYILVKDGTYVCSHCKSTAVWFR